MPLDEAITPEEGQELACYIQNITPQAIQPASARLVLFDREAKQAVDAGATEVTFEWEMAETGVTQMEAWFADAEGEEQGAYYVYVERVG